MKNDQELKVLMILLTIKVNPEVETKLPRMLIDLHLRHHLKVGIKPSQNFIMLKLMFCLNEILLAPSTHNR